MPFALHVSLQKLLGLQIANVNLQYFFNFLVLLSDIYNTRQSIQFYPKNGLIFFFLHHTSSVVGKFEGIVLESAFE